MSEETPLKPRRVNFSADLLAAADTPLPTQTVVKTPSGRLWLPNPAFDRMSDEAFSFKDAASSDFSQQLNEEDCKQLEAELLAAGLMAEGHIEAEKREQLLKHVRFYARVAARQKHMAEQQQQQQVLASGSNLTRPGGARSSGQDGGKVSEKVVDEAQKQKKNKRQDRDIKLVHCMHIVSSSSL